MATKRKTEGEPAADEEMQQIEFVDKETLTPALEAIYAELGLSGEMDSTVHVSKLDADGRGNEAKVWQGDPDQYDLESLVKKFGSGTYRVMIYVKNQTGQKVRKANKTISWLLSPEDEAKRVSALSQPQAQQPQQIQNGDVVAAMREMMNGFAGMIKDVLLAQAQNKPAEVDPLKTLEGVERIASMFKPAQNNGGDSFERTLGMFDKMLSLREKMMPTPKLENDDGEISLPAVALSFLKELKSMRQVAPVANAAPVAAQAEIAAPIENAAPQLTPAEIEEIQEMNIVLRYQLKQAVNAATGGTAAADYAENVYSVIPEEIILMMCGDPEWFAKLAEIAPFIVPHKAWFILVGERIKAMAIEDGLLTTPPVAPNTPGNGNDNAGTSTTN